MLEHKQMLGKLPWNIWKTVEKQLKNAYSLLTMTTNGKWFMDIHNSIYGYP